MSLYKVYWLVTVVFLGIQMPNVWAQTTQVTKQQADKKVVEQVFRETKKQMGTMVMLMVYGSDEEKAQQAFKNAFDEIERVEGLLSLYRSSSQLVALNQAAGKQPISLRDEVLDLFLQAQEISRQTNGAFDITFAGLSGLWNFSDNKNLNVVPSPAAVKKQLAFVDYKKLIIDIEKRTAFLKEQGMAVGVGGIGKGYAADRALAVLNGAGFRNCLVYVGGDIIASGSKGKLPWVIGIQDPRGPGYFATTAVEDMAVVTSGDYERYFEVGQERYHHIIDPRTGYPARGLRSVTVFAPNAGQADALATGVFVLGAEEGMKLVEKMNKIEVIMVDDQNRVYMSPGLKDKVLIQRSPTP